MDFNNFFVYALVGFAAQMVDGALGMAYGVTSTSFLLTAGLPPRLASASVHAAEVMTSGISGLSHLKFGNVDKKLFKRLVIPGVLGGIVGAYILSSLPGERIRPLIAVYLLIMGARIIYKATGNHHHHGGGLKRVGPLALTGGFFDAIGGGGWGPIVTSTLIANGNTPRFAIGSVNLAEFFVTIAQTATFFLALGTFHWPIILGLIAGGALAAPLAAHVCRKAPTRLLLVLVGTLIVGLSVRMLVQLLK